MTYYSDELIEEVRSRNDVVDVISGYVRLQKRGSTYFGLCPFHNEKTPSFSVSPGKQMYYCFGCGAGGNVFTFMMQYENFTFQEAMQSLADRAGIELPKQEMSAAQREAADRRSRLLEINKVAAKYFYMLLRSPQGAHALQYFEERKLSKETMQHFGLGYSNKYEGEPKYLNSPETMIFDKSRNLYGLNFARSSRRPHILLCEGYMDVIALHQAGFDNAVASLGTSFTSGHANLLKRYTKEVYLTFDSDGAGVKAALRAIPILKEAGLTAKVINMRPYKDPDEFIKALGAEEYQKRIDEAENSFMFEVRMLERDYDLADPESKTKFFYAVARKILNFEEELERENYIEAVAAKYQIGFEQLRSVVRSEGTRGGLTRERERAPLKSGVNDRKKKEDGMKQSQRLFLTWLIEDERLFDLTEGYISPDDFTEEIFRDVAKVLYEQHAAGEINPAQIISRFTDEEQQREAAALFHARLHPVETRQEKEKALKETILRIKKNSMDVRSGKLEPTDLAGLQRLIEDKKQLAQLQKMHISLD